MTSRYQVFGLRFALGAALLASACQHDSNADFDDRSLTSPDVGGSADSGGSNAAAGENPGTSGSEASGGSVSAGGKSSAGAAGSASAGKGGTASAGGKGGTDAGGTASQAGKAGQGGAAGSSSGSGGMAGMAGSSNPPEPITLETADIDDTYIASCSPKQNFGEAKAVLVDGSVLCRYDALLDVPRLELPAGALVSKATLTLTCTNGGDPITVAYANEAWKELTVEWSSRPEVGATIGTITCAEGGTVTLDLTAAFEAWLGGDHAANGIYLRTENTDGTDFASSEAEKVSARPQLSITYTLPIK